MQKLKILILAFFCLLILLPNSSEARKPNRNQYQDTVTESIWDWATTLGKLPKEKKRIKAHRRITRAKKRAEKKARIEKARLENENRIREAEAQRMRNARIKKRRREIERNKR